MRRRLLLLLSALATTAACSSAPPAVNHAATTETRIPAERVATAAIEAGAIEATSPPGRCARQRPGSGAARVGAIRQGSAVALAQQDGVTLAYVADEDNAAIHTFDVDHGVELAVTPLEGSPAQLLVLEDGRVAVALRDRNRVAILEPSARRRAARAALRDRGGHRARRARDLARGGALVRDQRLGPHAHRARHEQPRRDVHRRSSA